MKEMKTTEQDLTATHDNGQIAGEIKTREKKRENSFFSYVRGIK